MKFFDGECQSLCRFLLASGDHKLEYHAEPCHAALARVLPKEGDILWTGIENRSPEATLFVKEITGRGSPWRSLMDGVQFLWDKDGHIKAVGLLIKKDSSANLIANFCIATRLCWEFRERFEEYLEHRKIYSVGVSFFLAYYVYRQKHSPLWGHAPFALSFPFDLKAFEEARPKDLDDPWTKGGYFNSDRVWRQGVPIEFVKSQSSYKGAFSRHWEINYEHEVGVDIPKTVEKLLA